LGLFDTGGTIDLVATEAGNPYTVFVDGHDLKVVAVDPKVLVKQLRVETPSPPARLALRGDTLYAGFEDELRSYQLPDLELLRVYPLTQKKTQQPHNHTPTPPKKTHHNPQQTTQPKNQPTHPQPPKQKTRQSFFTRGNPSGFVSNGIQCGRTFADL
jgi:hypothetical protein